MKPVRIQRKRTPGWRMPPGAVYVGRPSKWGNPFSVTDFYYPGQNSVAEAAAEAVIRFRAAVLGFESNGSFCAPDAHPESIIGRIIADAHELRGKDLACWCPPDQPCHAEVLLELANAEPTP